MRHKNIAPCWLETRPNQFKALIWRGSLSATLRTGTNSVGEDIPVLQILMEDSYYGSGRVTWACHLRLQTWYVGPVHVRDSSQLRECSEWRVVSFEGTTLVISLPGERFDKDPSRKVSVTFLPWKNEEDALLEPLRISVYTHASDEEDRRKGEMDLPLLRFVE